MLDYWLNLTVSGSTLKTFLMLIFIDTNIYLDFYRIRRSDVSMKYLDWIDQQNNVILTGSQIEMEFKKHRQEVILESVNGLKSPDFGGLNVPAFLAASEPVKIIGDKKKDVEKQHRKVIERMLKTLKNPTTNDQVYKTLQRLFKNTNNPNNLHRELELRKEIRELAQKRYFLGYPPRKKNDTSIGDAINWEWIIHCAKRENSSVMIVSRDTDYGVFHKEEAFMNDWLSQEFKERVNRKRSVQLTNKLSAAMKAVKSQVTREMVEEEKRIVDENSNDESK
ncbi:MAG: PIN domain-containing protein [Bacteroidia bacterium]|nr:PIN domain-containing protein [Bacteroidia bacterium]